MQRDELALARVESSRVEVTSLDLMDAPASTTLESLPHSTHSLNSLPKCSWQVTKADTAWCVQFSARANQEAAPGGAAQVRQLLWS